MSTRAPSVFASVVRHELTTLAREKTFLLLLAIFMAMTFFSVYIGWSTRTTTEAIYHASVAYLAAQGVTSIVADPLTGVSPLLVFDNMLVYLLLIGALLAIVIGHRSFIRERAAGVLPLVFVRPISRAQYIGAKLLGVLLALTGIVFATYAVSAFSAAFIPALRLPAGGYAALLGFYAVSLVYLAFFAAVGLFFSVIMKNESTALFMPILVWVAAVFILPELTTGQNPVALLNPVTLTGAIPDQGLFFTAAHRLLSPFSVGQLYTRSALGMLGGGIGNSIASLFALLAYVGVAIGASAFALRRYAVTRDLYL